MTPIKEQPTLADYQRYVREMVVERGFDKGSVSQAFMLFLEECGELSKAARKFAAAKADPDEAAKYRLDHEAADVFIYLLDICNRFGIDLETAFREKEAHNETRGFGRHRKTGADEIDASSSGL